MRARRMLPLPMTAVLVLGLLAQGAGAEPEGRAALAGPVRITFPAAVPAAGGHYGKSVAIDGDRLLISAPEDQHVVGNTTYYGVGSVSLYSWDGTDWTGQRFLPPYWQDENDSHREFGASVGIDGGVFVVGTSDAENSEGNQTGTAWVYRLSNGSWGSTELSASDGTDGDSFGQSVAVSGDRVVVGAPTAFPYVGPGAAYVFDRSGETWTEAKLTVTGAVAGDRVGLGDTGVAVDGDVVVLGVPQTDHFGGESGETGRVHVFTNSGGVWAEQVLAPTGVSADDAFGWSVAVDGDRIVVGAPWDDGKGSDAGAAYVFEKSAGVWTQTKKMFASDGVADDQYGYSVAVSGDRIAVGAPGQGLGDVYSYTGSGSTWKSLDEAARATNYPARLGWDVDVDGSRIVAGAPWTDVSGIWDVGAAYLFEYQFCDGRPATLVGTDGDDLLVGTANNDVIVGLDGNDTITGGGGNDTICSGPGDDDVDGGQGNDRIFGEDGKDILKGTQGKDTIFGGAGVDTVNGGADDDLLYGGPGPDRMVDWSGNDRAYGEGGNDRFFAGDGDDLYNGGPGSDTIVFSASSGVTVDLVAGTATGLGSNTLKGFENVKGSPGPDHLIGSSLANLLAGTPGNDLIEGGGGDDTLLGGDGDDDLRGGAGNDLLKGNVGNDTLDGGSGTDICQTGETLISCE